jgi:hypothetical protein
VARVRREAIQTALRELRDHGYLVTKVRQAEGGKFDGQDYELADPWDPETVLLETRSTGDPSHGSPAPKEEHLQEAQSEEAQVRTSAPTGAVALLDIPVEPRRSIEDQFAEVWQLWPRSESKADAFKAYKAAVKIVDPDVLAGSVQAWTFTAVQVWARDKIPYFGTWLRGQRWTEEPPVVPVAAPGGRLRGGELLSDLTGLGAMMDAAGAAAAPREIER